MQLLDQNILIYLSHLNHYLWEQKSDRNLDCRIWFEKGCLTVCVDHLTLADQCVGLSRLLLGSDIHFKVMLKEHQHVIFELIP